jgi:subtilisin family serine protease
MRAVTLRTVVGLALSVLSGVVPTDLGAAPDRAPPPAAVAAHKLDLGMVLAGTAAGANDKIPVIVTLVKQADVRHIPGRGQAQRRRNLVTTLKATADSAQAGLRSRLAALSGQGRVDRIRYFWTFDGIALRATPSTVRELAARPDVRSVTLDATIPGPEAVTSGPPEPNLTRINAPALWSLGFRGQGVVVANMDTGVDVTHPDLAAQWRGGTNSWFDPNGQHPTMPTDVMGHGTWTMGVMVGRDSGGTAVGAAPDARWIAVKVFDDRNVATTSGIHAGFQWLLDPDGNPATDDAADVVDNSWALAGPGCDLRFQPDLQALRAANILPLFAAGNYGPTGSTSVSPANNPEAFAVGATDNADALWSGSSRGPSACGEPSTIYPELVAPGVGIHTTDIFGLYADVGGTSISAPHVAGGLALLLSAFPSLTADQQQAALTGSAADLAPAGPDNGSGYGRLDVLAAYERLANQPDFGVAAAPASATTIPGGSAAYTVTVTSAGGFTGTVGLSLSGLSASQASWTFTPPAIAGGAGTAQLTVAPAASLPPGTYPLTITASSGSLVRTATVTLTVNPPPDFGLSVTPASRTVWRGGATTYAVGVLSLGGFTGAVTLTVTGLPAGATAAFSPSPVPAPGASTLTVRTARWTKRGTSVLTVTGQNGPTTHRTTVTLVVK